MFIQYVNYIWGGGGINHYLKLCLVSTIWESGPRNAGKAYEVMVALVFRSRVFVDALCLCATIAESALIS